jgi:hypothetical protein
MTGDLGTILPVDVRRSAPEDLDRAPWADHSALTPSGLPMTAVHVGDAGDAVVGFARFDGDLDFAVVTVVPAPDAGIDAIAALVRAATAADGRSVNAYVPRGDDRLAAALTAAGYRTQDTVVHHGVECVRFDRPATPDARTATT